LEQYLADLNVSVGDEASTLEALMVEIRVAVPDATRVHGLMRRLAGLQSSWQNPSMIDSSRRHGHLDSRLRINGPRPRDPGDRSVSPVSPVPIASVS
jgi:hypothetical protein